MKNSFLRGEGGGGASISKVSDLEIMYDLLVIDHHKQIIVSVFWETMT